MPFIATCTLHLTLVIPGHDGREMCRRGIWRVAQLKGITCWFGQPGDSHASQRVRQGAERKLERLQATASLAEKGDTQAGECCSLTHRKADVSFLLSVETKLHLQEKTTRPERSTAWCFFPDFACAAKFNLALSRIGNITSDGRPILGLDAKELLKITLGCVGRCSVYPGPCVDPPLLIFGGSIRLRFFGSNVLKSFNAAHSCD